MYLPKLVIAFLAASAMGVSADAAPRAKSLSECEGNQVSGFQPATGVISSAAIAESMAKLIAEGVLGARAVESVLPFKAVLSGDEWEVTSSAGEDRHGGTIILRIRKSNAKVLYFSIEK